VKGRKKTLHLSHGKFKASLMRGGGGGDKSANKRVIFNFKNHNNYYFLKTESNMEMVS
jgi:hypothetical protein